MLPVCPIEKAPYPALGPWRGNGDYAYTLRLELWQAVRLTRDAAIHSLAATWSTSGVIGTVRTTHLGAVREAVRAMVDEFINDYRAANPKP
ncbi:MAG: hypothetical protein HY725_14165 [Candidatus Rokubacteria bacterium]|nr:hypothetical protein [Candidatus Rokubacteria bacterium]